METVTPTTHYDLEYYFELSPDLLCIAGYDGYFKKINPAVSATLGYSNEELFASPINSFVHPDDRNLTEQKRDALRNGNALLKFENRYLTKNGAIVWLSWTSMPVPRDKIVFAIAKDITYGLTPNKLVRVIRVHMAWEALASGKYRTIAEISKIAGYTSSAHFKKLFYEIYGIQLKEFL